MEDGMDVKGWPTKDNMRKMGGLVEDIDQKFRFIGIDPGKSGGWCYMEIYFHTGHSLPYIPFVIACGKLDYGPDGTVDIKKLDDKFYELTGNCERENFVVVEKQFVMRGQGLTSSGVTMYNYGKLMAFFEQKLKPHAEDRYSNNRYRVNSLLSPLATVWKKDMGLTANKEFSRKIATNLYRTDEYWPKKKDEGVAEAALLARWLSKYILQKYQY